MRISRNWTLVFSVSLCYVLAGCGGEDANSKTAEELRNERPAVTNDDHDHDHGHEHGHEHGHDEHDHHHHAPHHGSLTMIGDHVAQVELLVDPEAGRLEAYILDGEAEAPLAADQTALDVEVTISGETEPLPLKLVAVEEGKPESGYAVQHDKLKGVTALKATLASLKLSDKTHEKVAVEFDAKKAAEEADAAHEHGHEHKDADHMEAEAPKESAQPSAEEAKPATEEPQPEAPKAN